LFRKDFSSSQLTQGYLIVDSEGNAWSWWFNGIWKKISLDWGEGKLWMIIYLPLLMTKAMVTRA
jgi:hypothetical protein